MSSPSPASSVSSTPHRTGSATLTPSRKVQALLAQFSDSDSDPDSRNEGQPTKIIETSAPSHRTSSDTNESDSEDDEDVVLPRSRLAARLLADQGPTEPTASSFNIHKGSMEGHRNQDRESFVSMGDMAKSIGLSNEETLNEVSTYRNKSFDSSMGTDNEGTSSKPLSRSPSPLFFPSPGAEHSTTSPPTRIPLSAHRESKPSTTTGKQSKFLALVEKHRKERIAREAADIAKRAAGVKDGDDRTPKRARGSSPADDSDEDDNSADEGAVNRIQKQVRPTRKASRKALEEMNRETQRMNRNMQLAHKATTKHRITKESLLAKFNFSKAAALEDVQPSTVRHPASSSATGSDVDSENDTATTPATSPLRGIEHPSQGSKALTAEDAINFSSTKLVAAEMHGALAAQPLDSTGATEVTDMRLENQNLSLCQPKLKSIELPSGINATAPRSSVPYDGTVSTVPSLQPVRINFARTILARDVDPESDGEIEIVKDRGVTRKYAAFEDLPKRKAKEMPSHLALRSLAHLLGKDDKKRSMNSAELEVGLRKKARLQAIEQRQQKIADLKAKGIIIQTAAERERDQQEVEDLVERARLEAAEIQKREKELAKKEGTYIKDNLDDDDDSGDEDFEDEEDVPDSGSEDDEQADDDEANEDAEEVDNAALVDMDADEASSADEVEMSDEDEEPVEEGNLDTTMHQQRQPQPRRRTRIVSDDEDEAIESSENNVSLPVLPLAKTPQSVPRSARKQIPGLQMSDDLPMGLSQAFAATMAESQTQRPFESQEQDSVDFAADLPSPRFVAVPSLQRLDSIDLVSDSQPSASQTQPLNVNLVSQSQTVPDTPHGLGIRGTPFSPTQQQVPFEFTQDNGYILSPFTGNRFAQTPILDIPGSTVETVVLTEEVENSPILQRRGRLQRGRVAANNEPDVSTETPDSAFQVMQQAAKLRTVTQEVFDKKKSDARKIVDEAAEESEDEYAGLGGASDDSGDEVENEDDRLMIDEDTQVGRGDEAKLAGLYADRERERDEKEVSKLLKDITTGALRRKRGVGDDLDLSDEEDAAARRREAKRREFARMRRELLKDEAVGKIAEDKRKAAFLRSIEDHEEADDEDEEDLDEGTATDDQSQSQSQPQDVLVADSQSGLKTQHTRSHPLDDASSSKINRLPPALRRMTPQFTRKPATLAEIRESVSFLIEEPDSQAAMVDLGLSDSEDEPEAYVDLDRHFRDAEADENELDEDSGDLGDFVVADEMPTKQDTQDELFKKPELPRQERAPFSERRTKHNDVVDRLSLLREASSSASSTLSTGSSSSKMAFFSSKTGTNFVGVPSLLRRATTNSSLGSKSGRENVSATGVVTSKTERGNAGDEKEFIRKGSGGRRNAVNYQAERKTLREEKMSARAGVVKAGKHKGHGFLGGLFRGDSWE